MEKNQIAELISKFNTGLANSEEVKTIEQLIESGKIELTQLHELERLEQQVAKIETGSPSMRLDNQFYTLLSEEKKSQASKSISLPKFEWGNSFPRLALAASLIVAGFVGGYFLKAPSEDKSVKQLTQQVSELKEMIMLSMLEKESATERLKAVSLSSDMNQVSKKVTSALFKTLTNDENINVRLAALDVLMNYAKDGEVRAELIKSISIQDSPLVQLALAELMVALQERKSVTELRKLLDSDKTPKEVKQKIEKSINTLI
jgi:hypothetical protein